MLFVENAVCAPLSADAMAYNRCVGEGCIAAAGGEVGKFSA